MNALLRDHLAWYSLIHDRPGHEKHPLSYCPPRYRSEIRWIEALRLPSKQEQR